MKRSILALAAILSVGTANAEDMSYEHRLTLVDAYCGAYIELRKVQNSDFLQDSDRTWAVLEVERALVDLGAASNSSVRQSPVYRELRTYLRYLVDSVDLPLGTVLAETRRRCDAAEAAL